MKVAQIVEQLQSVIPSLTNIFSDQILIANMVELAGLVTVTTDGNHGLENGARVALSGITVPNVLTSLTSVGKIATGATTFDNDLTGPKTKRSPPRFVNIRNAADSLYNGLHKILSVSSKKDFTFELTATPVSPDVGVAQLDETLRGAYNGLHTVIVLDSTTFTFQQQAGFGQPAFDKGSLQGRARIWGAGSGAGGSIDRIMNAYTSDFGNNPVSVSSINRSGDIATVVTVVAHGYRDNTIVSFSGADQVEYNGARSVQVVDDTTLTFQVLGSPATPATGTIISLAEQLTAFVVFTGRAASKNRNIESDATDGFGRGTIRLQNVLRFFSVFVMQVVPDRVSSAADAVDRMADVLPMLTKSLLGFDLKTTLACGESKKLLSYVSDSVLRNNGGLYVHQFDFENSIQITPDDTFSSETVALRCFDMKTRDSVKDSDDLQFDDVFEPDF